jgi:putative aldouronate transport system substrate-binding protein
MKKRLFSLLVVGLMILSLVGCTAPSDATASSQGSASATAPSAAPADAAASQTAAPENVKPASAKDDAQPYYISMLLQTFATEPASDDNRALSYIEEYTNTDLDITWQVSNDYDTMIDVLVASGDVPMVLTVRDQKDSVIVQAVKSGFFWDITDYLDDTENFPNLSSYNRDVAAQVRYDGRLYSLYNAADLSRSGWHYRKDWAENLNLTIPETIDDIYEWARAFTEDDPDQNGKNDTFGLIMAADKAVRLEFHQMVINYGGGYDWVEDEIGDLIPTFMSQPYIDAMDFFRKCYENGYMNQDYPSAAKSTIYQYWQAGQGGLFYMSLNDAFGKNVTAIYDAIPGATNDVFNLIQSVTVLTATIPRPAGKPCLCSRKTPWRPTKILKRF